MWRNAELLAAADTIQQRRAAAEFIENYALTQARMIKSGTTISDSSARDAHCAAYRRTHRERGGQAAAKIGRRGLRARRGVVRVRVGCAERIRDCAGTLSLTRRGKRWARPAPISLEAGKSKVLRLRLTRAARRSLGRRKRLAVRVTAASPSPWGTTRTPERANPGSPLAGLGMKQVGERRAHGRAFSLGRPPLEAVKPYLEQVHPALQVGLVRHKPLGSLHGLGPGVLQPCTCAFDRVPRDAPAAIHLPPLERAFLDHRADRGRDNSSSRAVSGMPQVSI